MLWNIALNILLVVLMGAGIFYALRLQNALKDLQKNREAMERFVTDFTGSISRAEKAIRDLQDTARGVGQDVDSQIARAQGLRDELTFLVEAADKVASRLSDNAAAAQKDARQQRERNSEPEQKPVEARRAAPAPVQQQSAPPAAPQKPAEEAAQPFPAWAKRIDKDAAILSTQVEMPEPVSGLTFGRKPVEQPAQEKPRTVKPAPAPEPQPAKEQPRSQAERELLQALEKMR